MPDLWLWGTAGKCFSEPPGDLLHPHPTLYSNLTIGLNGVTHRGLQQGYYDQNDFKKKYVWAGKGLKYIIFLET